MGEYLRRKDKLFTMRRYHRVIVVQLENHLRLLATPWTAAHQTPLLCYLLEFTEIHFDWVNDAISSSAVPFSFSLQFFTALGSFPVSQLFKSSGQSIGASGLASVLPMSIQDWSPLGWTGWIPAVQGTLKSLLQHHSSKASILSALSFLYSPTLTSIHDYWKNHSLD